jgi:CRISPR type I-E-associated protein CasB/Cse2
MNQDEAKAFANRLNELTAESRRADRATVKRARTGHPTQRLLARRLYHQLIPPGTPHAPRTIDLVERVTTLFVLNPLSADGGDSLGRALRALAQQPDVRPGALERRFETLLTAGPDTFDDHLSRLLIRLHRAGLPVDYAQLTLHLQAVWHPSRWVQRRWVDDFWAPPADRDQETASTSGDTP